MRDSQDERRINELLRRYDSALGDAALARQQLEGLGVDVTKIRKVERECA